MDVEQVSEVRQGGVGATALQRTRGVECRETPVEERDQRYLCHCDNRLRTAAKNRGGEPGQADYAGFGQRTLSTMPPGAELGGHFEHSVAVFAVLLAEPQLDRTPLEVYEEGGSELTPSGLIRQLQASYRSLPRQTADDPPRENPIPYDPEFPDI